MKRTVLAAALAAAALTIGACGGSDDQGGSGGSGASAGGDPAKSGGTLTIGGWGGAYDKATLTHYGKPFTDAGGASLKFVDAPATQVARVTAMNQASRIDWDLLDSVAGPDAFVLADKGYLEPLPADLKSKLTTELGEGKVTDFGFTMGNLGYVIACNREKVKPCPKTMAEFFDTSRFPQERTIPSGAPLEMLTMAAVAAGTPAAETAKTPIDLDAAFAELDKIKPKVKVLWESGEQQEQVLRSGEVDLGLLWSGRAYRLQSQGQPIDIAWSGGGYEPGYWAVLKGSKNADRAFALMESIAGNVEGQAKWSQEMSYSVPNPKALDAMPAEKAAELADKPENFSQLAVPNFQWYVDNASEVNSRWQDYAKG
jgi:putative spermidine/putrescine transport system substrate-binding protein